MKALPLSVCRNTGASNVAYPQAWFQRNEKGQIVGSFSQVPVPKDGTPTWLPLIPAGTFLLEVADGEAIVDIKREYLDELVSHFKEGFPGPAGVPVDQRGDHSRNPEGAYAFFKDLRLDDDGVWGLFEPTEYGKEVIASGSLPYVSPVFCIGEGLDPVWGKSNILIDAALCSQPQFRGQPQMVMASAIAPRLENDEAASAAATHEGVSDMTPEEIQAQIDEAVAAAVDGVKAEIEQAHADALAAVEAEKDELQAKIDELLAKADDAEALKAELDSLKDAKKALEDAALLVATENEFAEMTVEVETVLPDGSKQIDLLKPTKEAVVVAAAAKAFPTADNMAAYWDHVKANGGKLAMETVPSSKPNLIQASAPAAGGPAASTDAQIDAMDWTDDAKAFVKREVAGGMAIDAAFAKHCRRLIPTK